MAKLEPKGGGRKALTEQEKTFCSVYATNYDPIHALLLAGYEIKNKELLSPEALRSEQKKQAGLLLRRPMIRKRVDTLRDIQTQTVEDTTARVRNWLETAFDVSIVDIYDRYGRLKPIDQWDELTRQMVQEIKSDAKTGELVAAKFPDKLAVLKEIMKISGGYAPKTTVVEEKKRDPFAVGVTDDQLLEKIRQLTAKNKE